MLPNFNIIGLFTIIPLAVQKRTLKYNGTKGTTESNPYYFVATFGQFGQALFDLQLSSVVWTMYWCIKYIGIYISISNLVISM